MKKHLLNLVLLLSLCAQSWQIHVHLHPQQAVEAGAGWLTAAEGWHLGNGTIQCQEDKCTIFFKNISGWRSPRPWTVTKNENAYNVTINPQYVEDQESIGSSSQMLTLKPGWNLLFLNIEPDEGSWAMLRAMHPVLLQENIHVSPTSLPAYTPFWLFSNSEKPLQVEGTAAECPTTTATKKWQLVCINETVPLDTTKYRACKWDGHAFVHAELLEAGNVYWIQAIE